MDELMTVDEVAELLRVAPSTIRWLRIDGRFAPAIKVGRRLVWERAAIEAWVEEHRERVA